MAKHRPVANYVSENEKAGKKGYINTTSYPKHDIDWMKFKKYMREDERNGSRNLKFLKHPREDEEKGAEAALKAACRQTIDDPVECKLSAHCPITKSAIENASCSGANASEGGRISASAQHEEAYGMVQTPLGKNEEKVTNTLKAAYKQTRAGMLPTGYADESDGGSVADTRDGAGISACPEDEGNADMSEPD